MFSVKNNLFATIILIFIGNFINNLQAQAVSYLRDDQVAAFVNQAQASGMSESEIEAAALAKGYSKADITSIRSRINNLKKGEALKDTDTASTRINKEEQIIDNITVREEGPQIFGMNVFQNKKLSFEPNLRLPTPKNYILGPEDELNIRISGYASQNYNVKIPPEGNILLENLSPIFIMGVSIEEAKERITNRLKAIMPGLSSGESKVEVTLGNVRSIKVMVIGEVVNPGTYTVSSLATAFHALYSCGGLNKNGSLRNIEVYRGGKLFRKIDVYDFLLRGDQRDNVALSDQDVIRVPFYETHVELIGEIKAPMIYEMKIGENFKTLLSFAGGFSDNAYTKAVNVMRITSMEVKMISIDQTEYNGFIPQKGDKYIVGKILDSYENKVMINGSVLREGSYELEKGLTLTQLIKKAEGLREDAFQGRVLIRRLRENLDPEIINIDLARIYKNEAPDVDLKRDDAILIPSNRGLREKRTISIDGSVNKTGTYDYADGMNVGDLVVLAGGFSDGASASRIEIARRVKSTDPHEEKTIDVTILNIDRGLKISNEDAHVTLMPFDKIFVRQLPSYEDQKTATIKGEVVYQGVYPILNKKERISDLIQKAGGLKSESDLKAATFIHDNRVVSVNLAEIIQNQENENNLLLYPNDVLEIPRKKQTITISGQVMNPITVAFISKLKFKDYIYHAGGYTDSARVNGLYVKYANGTLNKVRNYVLFRKYPKIEKGMEIIVPQKRHGAHLTATERIALGTGMASFATAIILLINYLKK